jgi:hypothetical protein
MKDIFQDSTTSESSKATILTILPKSCSIHNIQKVYPSASNFMIRRVKQLVMDQGIMSSPGKTLNEIIAEVVKSSYNSSEVSSVLPGKKDHISVKVSVVKIHKQK